MFSQRVNDQRRHHEGPATLFGLRRYKHQSPTEALQLVAHAHSAGLEVDVTPPQPERLSLAETKSKSYGKECFESMSVDCIQELPCLIWRTGLIGLRSIRGRSTMRATFLDTSSHRTASARAVLKT